MANTGGACDDNGVPHPRRAGYPPELRAKAQDAYCDALSAGYNEANARLEAAHVMGKTRALSSSTIHGWRKKDQDFADRVAWVHEMINGKLEARALQLAIEEGDRTMLIFLLKSRMRDVYGDHKTVQHDGLDGLVKVVGNINHDAV